ncbi:MAG: ubiquitin-like domain-containing protein [Chloroflexota bacterium]
MPPEADLPPLQTHFPTASDWDGSIQNFPVLEKRRKRLGILMLAGLALTLLCAVICAAVLIVSLIPSAPPVSVTIMIGDEASQTETRAATVEDVLQELSLTINDGDTVSPIPETPVTAGLVIRIARARDVTLVVDDQSNAVRTLFTNPLDILNEAGLTVGEKDRIWVDGTQTKVVDMLVWPVPATQITIRHAITVQLNDDGHESNIQTASATVGEALFEAGITLYLADTVTPGINAPITARQQITIQRSSPISIVADGVTLETRAQGTTVGDGLSAAGVNLMGMDYSIPDETSVLQPGMLIRVIRVTESVIQDQETIPFETLYQGDPALEIDQLAVAQEGQNGIQKTDIRVHYENGIEISRQAEGSVVAVDPLNRIVSYGTNVVIRSIDTPDGPREYWRRIRLYATSYHPSTLGGDNITATGRVLTKGVVGIDPTVIPYGTELFVPGYGVGIAADTGGPRRTRLWIDLGYDDSNWVSWSKPVDVYLLTPVPAQIDYILPD